ncbi:unnamed protein product [Cuscuta campestris]|uniref:Uncharacterized protein n=1 Tax=Cuscuta campestris TaxID=132261 RepID=A0A484LB58_9ASTE|nr:unnamed protein product [Cuscuta campestris]
MKREGRQHGLVPTCPVLPPLNHHPRPPQPKHIYSSSCSAPTAGPFSRVSSKPTNHSKFTGRCARAKCLECHVTSAAGKAKGKAKGTLKQRTADAVADNKSIAWRVGNHHYKPCHDVPGFSATGILDHLAGVDYTDHLEAADDDDEYL